jgi:hypothetical protein
MWVLALASVALLGAPRARAEEPAEKVYATREELPQEEQQELIGVATVHVGPGAPWVLTRFEPSDEQAESGFRAAGQVVLAETAALSGFSFEDAALRRYPVVARSGSFLQLIIDVRTGERAWVREQPESGTEPSVSFELLDEE